MFSLFCYHIRNERDIFHKIQENKESRKSQRNKVTKLTRPKSTIKSKTPAQEKLQQKQWNILVINTKETTMKLESTQDRMSPLCNPQKMN